MEIEVIESIDNPGKITLLGENYIFYRKNQNIGPSPDISIMTRLATISSAACITVTSVLITGVQKQIVCYCSIFCQIIWSILE